MTDPITREDLEMAAKAAGNPQGRMVAGGGLYTANELYWNPAEDDGDCARMEAAVEINVRWIRWMVRVSANEYGIVDADFADHANDKSRARRYASVKLAAAVGRGMA